MSGRDLRDVAEQAERRWASKARHMTLTAAMTLTCKSPSTFPVVMLLRTQKHVPTLCRRLISPCCAVNAGR